MSPGSMTLPTMNNWDMNQAMSPYIPPDMNSKYIEMELISAGDWIHWAQDRDRWQALVNTVMNLRVP
jgi:hypothetical protein